MPIIDSVDMGRLTDFLFVFTNGSQDANWQGASKGYVGDVAVNGLVAAERTSGFVPYAGTIFTNAATCGAWQQIVTANPGQASCSTGQTVLLADLQANLASAFAQINALPVTPGFESRTPQSLDGLNTQNGICETIVINLTSGFQVSTQINITGDACDVFILRWDEDANPANGYQGTVKFQSGGAIVPHGGLIPSNFINVAGVIQSSGGGTTPPPPYPQGPRFDDGLGPLIVGGQDFSGGGFFTGYWLTTGDPVTGENGSMSNAIFVGGWYTSNTKFSLTSGSSGVYVAPNPSTVTGPCISLQKLISTTGPGGPFVPSPVLPGVILPSGTQPFFQFIITNCGSVTLEPVTLVDTVLGPIILPVPSLAAGASTSVILPGTFLPGPNCNTGTTTGTFTSETGTIEVTATASACFTGAVAPAISLVKLVSVDCGVSFQPASVPPFPVATPACPPQYEFRVTNIGNEALTNIVVNDATLGIVNFPIPNLPIGATTTTVPVFGTFHVGQFCNTAIVTGNGVTTGTPVTAASTACFVGELGPAISLVKEVSVNCGVTFQPASVPPFPTLVQGTCPPQFRFVITNTGSVTLNNITLSESSGLPIPALPASLAPGETFTTLPVTGTFALGQNCNTATVSGTPTGGTAVTATSTACFVGVTPPVLTFVKEISVSGPTGPFVPASTAPFPILPAGTTPFFRFVVTNPTAFPATLVTITDNVLGSITFGGTILPGQTAVFGPVAGTFSTGQHCNTATLTAVILEQPITQTSTACFVGQVTPCLSIVKQISVSGAGGPFVPASTAPFPILTSPQVPFFRFVVTNNCETLIEGITVVDTVLGPITLPVTSLAPGQSFTTTPVQGTFAVGQHCNTATATGTTASQTVTGTSTACFVGVVPGPSILVQKLISVNGGCTFVASPSLPGPTVVPSTPPKFLIIVTNNGTVPLTNITVVDTLFGPITIPTTTLAPGQSFQVKLVGPFIQGPFCNTVTATGVGAGQTVTSSATACFTGGVPSPVPVFPNISGPAPQNEIIDRLLETVALEELALSALVNAEAQKVQAVSAAGVMGPVEASDLEAINNAVANVIAQAAEKERRLLTKLNRILAHKERQVCDP